MKSKLEKAGKILGVENPELLSSWNQFFGANLTFAQVRQLAALELKKIQAIAE